MRPVADSTDPPRTPPTKADAAQRRDFARFADQGDVDALGRVFDSTAPKLLLLAQHLGRDAADAEDLVQTTFVAAMRDAHGYDRSRPLLSWLTGILANRAADLTRRRARRRELSASSQPEDPRGLSDPRLDSNPEALLSNAETRERIAAAIDDLPTEQRDVLVLRLLHGLSAVEAAHALGRPPATVRTQCRRGLARLRKALGAPESGRAAVGLAALVALRDFATAQHDTLRDSVLAEAKSVAAALTPAAGLSSWPGWTWIMTKTQVTTAACIVLALAATLALLQERPRPGLPEPGVQTPPPAALSNSAVGDGPPAARPDPGTGPVRPRVEVSATTSPSLVVTTHWPDGSPAPSVSVRVVHKRHGRRPRVWLSHTDASARAAFFGLPAADLQVSTHSTPKMVRVAPGQTTELALEAQRQGDVVGLVMDAFGRPVRGATVWISQTRSGPPGSAGEPLTTTDADGRFAAPLRQAGVAVAPWLSARAPGHANAPWTQFEAADHDGNIVIRLEASGGTITGLCIDESGEPVVDADVTLQPLGFRVFEDAGRPTTFGHEATVRTDTSGGFAVAGVAPGRWVVEADTGDLWFDAVEVDVTRGSTPVRIELIGLRRLHVRGTVTDRASGSPIAGASIVPRPGPLGSRRTPWLYTESADDGSFSIPAAPPTALTLEVGAGGFQPVSFYLPPPTPHDAPVGSARPVEPDEIRIALERRPALRGTARWRTTGEPVAGWTLTAWESRASTEIAADGSFELSLADEAAAGASISLWISAPDSAFKVSVGDVLPTDQLLDLLIDDQLARSGFITGSIVTDIGAAPESRTYLNVIGPTAQRSATFGDCTFDPATGRFRIGPLPPGSPFYIGAATWYPELPGTQGHRTIGEHRVGPFTLTPGETRDIGEIAVPVTGMLRVRLSHAPQVDPSEIRLEWHDLDAGPGSWGLVMLRQNLAAEIRVLPGRYSVTVWGRGFCNVDREIAVDANGLATLDIRLEPGARRPIELRIPAGESSVAVEIRGADGSLAFDDELTRAEAPVVQRWPNLAVGSYTVKMTAPNGAVYRGRFAIESLTPTRRPVVVTTARIE